MQTLKQATNQAAATFLVAGTSMLLVMATSQGIRTPQPVVNPAAVVQLLHNQCWSGQEPADMAGKTPSFVLYERGVSGLRIGGQTQVAWALERVARDDTDGIYAFCR